MNSARQFPGVGVLGGTFDPVHIGHLNSANELKTLLGLECIYLMPCKVHALDKQPRASATQRLEMLQLAVADYPGLRVDDRELRREGVSYTVDSLREIRSELGAGLALFFILGSDAFRQLPSWHRWEQLFDYANLVVMQRGGEPPVESVDNPDLQKLLNEQLPLESAASYSHGQLFIARLTQFDVASSGIRQQLGASGVSSPDGGSSAVDVPESRLRDLPPAVAAYIRKHGIYGGNFSP